MLLSVGRYQAQIQFLFIRNILYLLNCLIVADILQQRLVPLHIDVHILVHRIKRSQLILPIAIRIFFYLCSLQSRFRGRCFPPSSRPGKAFRRDQHHAGGIWLIVVDVGSSDKDLLLSVCVGIITEVPYLILINIRIKIWIDILLSIPGSATLTVFKFFQHCAVIAVFAFCHIGKGGAVMIFQLFLGRQLISDQGQVLSFNGLPNRFLICFHKIDFPDFTVVV